MSRTQETSTCKRGSGAEKVQRKAATITAAARRRRPACRVGRSSNVRDSQARDKAPR
jgi:hypothetical protein